MTIPEVVKKYRKDYSLREFAQMLSEGMPHSISHQAVKFWEDGTWKPSIYYMLVLAENHLDWRSDFAQEVLQILQYKN
jgi:hypothetical protein